jgi:hypothetical protein
VFIQRQVSIIKGINHTIGKICVPFDPEKVDQFDVEKVPTLT